MKWRGNLFFLKLTEVLLANQRLIRQVRVCRMGFLALKGQNIFCTVQNFAECGAEKGRNQVLAGSE